MKQSVKLVWTCPQSVRQPSAAVRNWCCGWSRCKRCSRLNRRRHMTKLSTSSPWLPLAKHWRSKRRSRRPTWSPSSSWAPASLLSLWAKQLSRSGAFGGRGRANQGHSFALRDDTLSLLDRGELPACGGGEERVRSSGGRDDPAGQWDSCSQQLTLTA